MSLNCLLTQGQAVFREKGSRFLGIAVPVQDETEVLDILASLRKQYHDATHHCYAWRLNPPEIKEFSQDDGEPSGTAGLPILNKLRSRNLMDTMVVVIRYYGGTKLGKSGLIQAYGQSAEIALDNASTAPLRSWVPFRIDHNYSQTGLIEQLLDQHQCMRVDGHYSENVVVEVRCPAERAPGLQKALEAWLWSGIEFTYENPMYKPEYPS